MRNLLTAIGLVALYEMVRGVVAPHGVMLTRKQFLLLPGQPIMLPVTAIELAQRGAQIVGWSAHITPVTNALPVRLLNRN